MSVSRRRAAMGQSSFGWLFANRANAPGIANVLIFMCPKIGFPLDSSYGVEASLANGLEGAIVV